MDNRLDKFIELLEEALQPHGGCQCGCAGHVLGAVCRAKAQLIEFDEEQERIEDQALNDAMSDRRYGSNNS